MQLSRLEVKALKLALKSGDGQAARSLLAHSVALGHERLAIRRYYEARFFGAKDLALLKAYCVGAASNVAPIDLLKTARDVARDPDKHTDLHLVASELVEPSKPFVLPYDGVWPALAGEPVVCARLVSLLGRIKAGARSWFGRGAVIRADGHFVQIGNDFRLGEMSTVHIAHDILPAIVGERVSVGRNAVVHACTIGDDCVIENDVVILDGTVVEDGVVVEAGSTVFPRSILKAGFVCSGSPAKPVRELATDEREARAMSVHESIASSLFALSAGALSAAKDLGEDVLTACTARLVGRVEAARHSSIFFGCRLNAGANAIVIGESSNVQDNTNIDASEGSVTIGENTTIGHNVRLQSSSVGSHSLIGIGSNVSCGTVVDDDVLLAAGSVTASGQHLERGWLWGGRPARPIARLDDGKRAMMAATIQQYRAYAAAYQVAQIPLEKKGRTDGTSVVTDSYPDW
ncbi:gamma carbonic anhydrase family protein [Mesorhizobium argentiipisi]|uniref:Gamma carbonic anhydrase family protein n=1 Tax=Mesorhizobium argentiipisi TaxID=3015175 RepID=A0ABU8KNQ7_9HYPH